MLRRFLLLCLLSLTLTAPAWAQAAAKPETTEKFATLYGAKIRYVEAGSGPTVVLLHGMGGNAESWAATIPALAQKYHVIAPDQIGFGKSDKPLIPYRVAVYVDFLDALLKELKIDKATLVGNSLGGWIAASYTLTYPARVAGLVLVDAAGYAAPKEIDLNGLYGSLNPTTRAGVRDTLRKVFYNQALADSDLMIDMGLRTRIMAGDGYTINALVDSVKRGEDTLDGRLKAVTVPTLIVWGRQDGLTPLALGEQFKKDIPNAQLVVIDKCGHVPQVEQSAEFNAALLKFLN